MHEKYTPTKNPSKHPYHLENENAISEIEAQLRTILQNSEQLAMDALDKGRMERMIRHIDALNKTIEVLCARFVEPDDASDLSGEIAFRMYERDIHDGDFGPTGELEMAFHTSLSMEEIAAIVNGEIETYEKR